jgi:hypothetical protein
MARRHLHSRRAVWSDISKRTYELRREENEQELTQSVSDTQPGAFTEAHNIAPASLHLSAGWEASRLDPPFGTEGTTIFPHGVDAVDGNVGDLDEL